MGLQAKITQMSAGTEPPTKYAASLKKDHKKQTVQLSYVIFYWPLQPTLHHRSENNLLKKKRASPQREDRVERDAQTSLISICSLSTISDERGDITKAKSLKECADLLRAVILQIRGSFAL